MRAFSQAAAAGSLALAVMAGSGSAAWASDSTSTLTVDAGDDGSCDTRPVTYPADGEPVPDIAACELLVDGSATVVGEVWSWADADSVQWYSYVAASVGDLPVGGAVVMCGSTDTGEYGDTYACSPDSTYLLFTVEGVFVEWPTSLSTDLYYCQLTAFGDDGSAVLGRACGTVAHLPGDPPGDGEGGVSDTGPSPTTTPSESPTQSSPSPSQTSTAPPADDPDDEPSTPADSDPPGETATSPEASPTQPATSASSPGPVESSSSAPAGNSETASPTQGSSTGSGTVDDSRAIESESVARVGGSPVPMGFLLVLAGALALGGYLMLAGPGLLAARRQRR